jgi:hypothetical protein
MFVYCSTNARECQDAEPFWFILRSREGRCIAAGRLYPCRMRLPSPLLPLLLGSSLALGGCAASLAASAVGAAVGAGNPQRPTDQDLREPAATACRARAAPLGRVRIIDADQRPDGRVKVWGIVEDDRQRRSFECNWDGRVRDFELRSVRAR